jgi:spastin
MATMAIITEDQKRRLASFKSWHERGLKMLQEAISADETSSDAASKREAIAAYEQAVAAFESGLRSVPNAVPAGEKSAVQNRRQVMQTHLESARDRIGQIRKDLKTSAKLFASKEERQILECIVLTKDVKFEDVLGNEVAKQALEEAVIWPALNPNVFTDLRAPTKGILLFGPPGNGKTMLAKAVANEAGYTFFSISAASMTSKWFGEAEKNMQALFKVARAKQPSIIFIDEIDSMLCARGDDESSSALRRLVTEFLLQFDGVTSNESDRILVLGATNRPFDLDDGVLRRFPRRIGLEQPNAEARAHHILHSYRNTNHNFTPRQLKLLGENTVNYSYSDLAALCREAAKAPLRSLTREQLKAINRKDVRPVTYDDLVRAQKVVRPSTTSRNVQKLNEFARDYAQT